MKRLLLAAAFAAVAAGASAQTPPAATRTGVPATVVSSAPFALGNWNSITTAFTGDLSVVRFPISYQITGVATLGQPSSGYKYTEETSAIAGYLYNSSGWNQNTNGNGGRTGATFSRVKVFNTGQGDAVAYNFDCFVTGQKAGATSFLANPACSGFNGNALAGSNGVYLNPTETALNDGGFDVAAVGYVSNLNRTVNTGALGAYWSGVRVQSKGTAAIDHAYVGNGPIINGIDFSQATISGAPIVSPLQTPASSTAACTTGSVLWDANFIYVCTSTNNFKRATLVAF
jgi:hypothetical protein